MLLCLTRTVPVRADGLPLTTPPTEAQGYPVVSPDDKGGAFVSYRTATLRIGSVHVGSTGIADGRGAFGPNTLSMDFEGTEPLRVLAVRDSGVMFLADRASIGRPIAMRYRANGLVTPGFPAFLPAMPFRHPVAVPGRAGRTVLFAMDSDTTSYWTLRTAILLSDGSVDSLSELRSNFQFFAVDRPAACRDSSGGMIAAMSYYDAIGTGSKDIGIFRIAANGSHPWGEALRPMVIATRDQTNVKLAPDGLGGALMVWEDPRSNVVGRSSDIFALHFDKNAVRIPGWNFYGSAICDAQGAQTEPSIAPDGTGGAWIVWWDRRNSLDGDLRFTHVLGNGSFAPGFALGGTVLCDAVGVQREASVVGDGGGGCFIVWRDERSGDADIYAQHITASGTIAAGWTANGRAVAIAPGTQDQPTLAPVLTGRVIVAWRDARTAPARIYTTALVDASVVDAPPASLTSLRLATIGPHALRVSLGSGEATLELLDVAGRIQQRHTLVGPAAGLELPLASELRPGLYFARLRQGAAQVSTRVTVLR